MIPYSKSAYKLLHNGVKALAIVEANGIRIDEVYLEKTIENTEKKIKQLKNKLNKSKVMKKWEKVYGRKMKLGSNDQLGKILFDHMKIKGGVLTPSEKQYKVDEKSLGAVKHPFVKAYLRIKKLEKTLSTYLKGIQREIVNGRVHPSFNLHIVKTYRSSCNAPNFQNIPKRNAELQKLVRQAVVPSIGNYLAELDYSGLEVCISAAYHKDPLMVEYLSNPEKDLHRDMSMECYMISAKQMTKEVRFYGKNMFVFPQFYGSLYTECAQNLWEAIDNFDLTTKKGTPLKKHLEKRGIMELGSTDKDDELEDGTFVSHIERVARRFWKKFSVYARWKKKWYGQYLDQGYFKTKTGFICKGYMSRNEVINYPVQGAAFHCLLWSLIRLQKELKKRKMKTKIIGQIHDSIIADVPAKELKKFLKLAEYVSTTLLMKKWKWINVPLSVEAEVSPLNGNWFQNKEMEIPK